MSFVAMYQNSMSKSHENNPPWLGAGAGWSSISNCGIPGV